MVGLKRATPSSFARRPYPNMGCRRRPSKSPSAARSRRRTFGDRAAMSMLSFGGQVDGRHLKSRFHRRSSPRMPKSTGSRLTRLPSTKTSMSFDRGNRLSAPSRGLGFRTRLFAGNTLSAFQRAIGDEGAILTDPLIAKLSPDLTARVQEYLSRRAPHGPPHVFVREPFPTIKYLEHLFRLGKRGEWKPARRSASASDFGR